MPPEQVPQPNPANEPTPIPEPNQAPEVQPQSSVQPLPAAPAAYPTAPPAFPTPPQRSKKKLLLALLLVIVLLLLAGGGWYYWHKQQNNPTKTFDAALTKLMQVKTITQTASDPDTGIIGTEQGDLATIKNPKISLGLSVKDSGLAIKFSGYGTPQNEYIKYTSFGDLSVNNAASPIIDKWVQIRTNGVNADGADEDLIANVDPYALMLGDLFVGNYSPSQRQTILDAIAKDKIYTYDTKKVTTATVHGKKVYVYAVTENIPKLKALNIKVAAMMGLKQSDIQKSVLDQLGISGTTKMYIDIATKEVVQYTATADGDTITGSYTDYDTTSLPQEPKADYTWAQFEQKEAALAGGALSGGSSDTRSSDLQQI